LNLLLPVIVFGLVFVTVLYVAWRSQRISTRLNRHEIASAGDPAAGSPLERTRILVEPPSEGSVGKLATKASSQQLKSKAAKLLRQAGDPMPLGTYLLMRACFTFVLTPLAVVYMYRDKGLTGSGIIFMLFLAFIIPNLPSLYIKRKMRKRTSQIERAMPDALDLLVVSVEGGLSLDGGLHQVAQRTEGLLAEELRRVLAEVGAGMPRREGLQGLASRTASQSLGALCTTIIQAEKMGVSIAATLRTLAETLRTRRRQAAETQARKAPIKMMPFLVFFMLPSLFIVILGPVVVSLMQFFKAAS
jgi:tight adherence protein C